MKRYYGEETQKAIVSFGMGSTPNEVIKAYGEVKKATLMAQQECFSLYSDELYTALIESVDEIINGLHNDQFPLSLRQGGAGTSLHMNINEVIAGLTEHKTGLKIDSLDDIAKYQSTNDTLPTAVTIMVYRQLDQVESLVIRLQELLVSRETEYSDLLMTGRTELQDALPITLGQVFGGWAGSIERDRWRLHKLKERLRTIALGGTAMGTCFSAPRKYVFKAEKNLRQISGLPLCRSQNLVDEISNQDNLAEVASGFRLLCLNIKKMTGDLLLYSSSFSRELEHKEMQYGSTIMPFKSNPIHLEYAKGMSIAIKSECDKIVDFASEGQLQLNPFLPFIADSFITINNMLSKALKSLTDDFFPNMKVNKDIIRRNFLQSPALINTLRQVLGYRAVKELRPLIEKGNPETLNDLKILIFQNTTLTEDFLDQWFDISNLTGYSEIR